LPGAAEQITNLQIKQLDLYAQDEIKFSDKFKFTVGFAC
jgi:hypothetical protein